ncbi:hypothetical protein QOT17_020300 [Balamuthia mandrillaris]
MAMMSSSSPSCFSIAWDHTPLLTQGRRRGRERGRAGKGSHGTTWLLQDEDLYSNNHGGVISGKDLLQPGATAQAAPTQMELQRLMFSLLPEAPITDPSSPPPSPACFVDPLPTWEEEGEAEAAEQEEEEEEEELATASMIDDVDCWRRCIQRRGKRAKPYKGNGGWKKEKREWSCVDDMIGELPSKRYRVSIEEEDGMEQLAS